MEQVASDTALDTDTSTADEKRVLTAELKDKVVVVTGGSRGLGKAIAEAFAEHEARVIVASRTQPDPPRDGSLCMTWIQVDVTEVDRVRALERYLQNAGGTLDVLVNNAGIINREQPMLETPVTDLLRVIDVNLKGPMLMSRLLVPLMKDRRGLVINVGSSIGRSVRPGMLPYGTSKAGLRHHSANLAVELADMRGFSGVRIFAVDPGGMDTAMRYVAFPEETDKSSVANPKQVAAFFTRLAAGWITTDAETGQPLRSGQELIVKRYMPGLWPEGSRISKAEKQGRLYT